MRHRPDHEMEVMRNGMRLLAKLSPAGRQRVVAYWTQRLTQFPPSPDASGEQQLDIEDVLRSEPLAAPNSARLTN
jgi:hypothetical protein